MMRAFLGVPIAVPEAVARLLADLAGCGADLKVTPVGNLHVTLKFLGDIPDAQATAILERLQAAGLPHDYEVELQGVGAFPDWKRFNVVWMGIRDHGGELARSFAAAEGVFAGLGFPVEPRPFTPHATLARRRSDRGIDHAKRLLEPLRNERFGTVQVKGAVLFRSHIGPGGPAYERLGTVTA